MNKLKTIGLALLSVGVAFYVRKMYKREKAKFEKHRKEVDAELNEIGISGEKMREEVEQDEIDNLVKQLYIGTAFNSSWETDIIDPDECINSDKCIHVLQSEKVTQRGREVKNLDFLIQIPNYTRGSYGDPKIGDYIRTFNLAATTIWEEIVKFCEKPGRWLVGYVAYSYILNGTRTTEFIKLDPEVYKNYADENHDGLSKFYEVVCAGEMTDEDKESLRSFISNYSGEKEIKVHEIILMYKISFKLQTYQDSLGIDLKRGLEALRYLTEEMVVKRRDSKKEVTYRNIMFNAPNENTGEWDLASYYDTDENNRVIVDSYSYCDDNDDIA